MTPIFVSHNEGNHRALIGTRSYYGFSVDSSIPLDTYDLYSHRQPDSSTVFQNLDYIYYIPKGKITNDYLEELRKLSKSIATNKTSYIPLQWSDALKHIYNEMVKSVNMNDIYDSVHEFSTQLVATHNAIVKQCALSIATSLTILQPPLVESDHVLTLKISTPLLEQIESSKTFTNLSNKPIGLVGSIFKCTIVFLFFVYFLNYELLVIRKLIFGFIISKLRVVRNSETIFLLS